MATVLNMQSIPRSVKSCPLSRVLTVVPNGVRLKILKLVAASMGIDIVLRFAIQADHHKATVLVRCGDARTALRSGTRYNDHGKEPTFNTR